MAAILNWYQSHKFLNAWSCLAVIVNEWLLLNAKWAIFQIYDGKNKLHFDEMMMMMMMSTLYEACRFFYSVSSLKQVSRWTLVLYLNTLSRFWDSEPTSLILCNYWLWNRLLSGFINLKKCNIDRDAGVVNTGIHF